MSSQSSSWVENHRFPTVALAEVPNRLRFTKQNRLFWMVSVLLLCWLPTIAYLAVEKSRGNHFGTPPLSTEAKTADR